MDMGKASFMARYLRNLWFCFLRYKREENAATMVEYGVLVAFISIFIMGTVLAIGDSMEGYYNIILDYILSVQE